MEYLQALDSSVKSIIIPDWACNDKEYTIFDFSRFFQVESIEIGNNCFESVQSFSIDGFNTLKSLKIGSNSFTKLNNVTWTSKAYDEIIEMCDRSKSFQIRNCASLESIEIGEYSFSDFAGDFELKNLNSLQSIKIGTIGYHSGNFFNNSFVIRGNELNEMMKC